ncbi:F-box/kelch-repeat protein At3g06240-like isoform X2 [Lotus japonicus]|nr:F-box/kelch-repeat protein At3g06240-like isoform X2 [Lotus japonicus]
MKRRKGSLGSARATRRSKRVAVAEKVDDDVSESQQLGVSFDDIPSHITAHILGRLPVKSVFICKSVCRRWKAVISDPHFPKLHFQHASAGLMILATDRKPTRNLYLLECESEKIKNDDIGQFCCCEDSYIKPECNRHFKLEHKLKVPLDLDKSDEAKKRGGQSDDNKFAVVNSCNGFLCLSDVKRNCFVVCNPVTGEFIRLPEPPRIDRTGYTVRPELKVGFGFQPKTNEYKVVRIIFKGQRVWRATQKIMGVEIHTLGTSTWRNVEVDPMHVSLYTFPTYVNGALYWISGYHKKSSIFCFDFESESFQSFPYPPRSFVIDITMGEYGGSLYICNSSSTGHINMWIMKKYGFEASWTNIFSIDITSKPKGGLCWPVKHIKNGGAVLMCHSSDCFIYYEPLKYGFKIFKIRGAARYVTAIPHIPSLISLKDAVKGDNIEVMNVDPR